MTRHATAGDFAVDGREFKKAAVYFPSMDFVDYVREDGVKICERVDEFLTVYWNENEDMIGFKLKGVKNFFLTKLQPVMSLADEDFVWVRDLFVALAQAKGDEMFPDSPKREHRKSVYKRAARMAREDSVGFVPPTLMAA